jgi:hypothetical protein
MDCSFLIIICDVRRPEGTPPRRFNYRKNPLLASQKALVRMAVVPSAFSWFGCDSVHAVSTEPIKRASLMFTSTDEGLRISHRYQPIC